MAMTPEQRTLAAQAAWVKIRARKAGTMAPAVKKGGQKKEDELIRLRGLMKGWLSAEPVEPEAELPFEAPAIEQTVETPEVSAEQALETIVKNDAVKKAAKSGRTPKPAQSIQKGGRKKAA